MGKKCLAQYMFARAHCSLPQLAACLLVLARSRAALPPSKLPFSCQRHCLVHRPALACRAAGREGLRIIQLSSLKMVRLLGDKSVSSVSN